MKKLGLVLSGGGARGAYQIGVWKCLREHGLDKNIMAFSGTSIGALNACLIMHGDYCLAEHIWTHNIKSKIFYLSIDSILKGGVFSRKGILGLLDKHIDLNCISNDQRALFVACLSVPNFRPRYFKLNGNTDERIKTILCATSALLVLFPPERIDGSIYVDGGLPMGGDDLPIKPLYDYGCDTVIAVRSNREGKSIIDRDAFPNLEIYEIHPEVSLGKGFKGLLDFSESGIKARIYLGYNDTRRILAPLFQNVGASDR